jgi:SAM-dependent methyltransferase
MESLDSIRKYLDEENIIPRHSSDVIKDLGENYHIYEQLVNEKKLKGNTETDLKFYEFLAKKIQPSKITIYDLIRSRLREAIEFNLLYASGFINESDTVLCVGCETGLYPTYLAQKVKKVIYLDLSRHQLAVAKERAERRGLKNTEFKVANMDDTHIPQGSIDCLICFDAIKEVSEKNINPLDSPYLDQRIREFRRVLRKSSDERNGRLIVSTTCEVPNFNPDTTENLFNEAEKLMLKIKKVGFNGDKIHQKYGMTIDSEYFITNLFDLQVRD